MKKEDYNKAIELLKKAAELGYLDAKLQLDFLNNKENQDDDL